MAVNQPQMGYAHRTSIKHIKNGDVKIGHEDTVTISLLNPKDNVGNKKKENPLVRGGCGLDAHVNGIGFGSRVGFGLVDLASVTDIQANFQAEGFASGRVFRVEGFTDDDGFAVDGCLGSVGCKVAIVFAEDEGSGKSEGDVTFFVWFTDSEFDRLTDTFL